MRDEQLPSNATPALDWTNVSFLFVVHLIAVFAIVYVIALHTSWWSIGLAGIWLILCGASVTGGYHRLFAHRSYQATWPLRILYLFFGAAAVQNSALHWAADHRGHHASTDRMEDPYNIQRGFWWAHLGWVLYIDDFHPRRLGGVSDLIADRLVRFQNRFYVPLAVAGGAVLPFAIGALWGDALGALLLAGFLRTAIQWHMTFAVNSFSHLVGCQPYSRGNSARDSLWVALISLGEGYHNFHHRFPGDYRNGIRWYQFDPTKWLVWSLSRLGLASHLRFTPKAAVVRARGVAALEIAGQNPTRGQTMRMR